MDIKDFTNKAVDFLSIGSIFASVAAVGIWSARPLFTDNPASLSSAQVAALTAVAATSVILVIGSLLSKKVFEPREITSSTFSEKLKRNAGEAFSHYLERDFLSSYAQITEDSRSVARTLFSRAGVYIIVGVLAAIIGIVLFEIMIRWDDTAKSASSLPYLFRIAPNLSVLLLCELIAFFFLRQSRALMDEFRYFDGIARHREEVLALLHLNKEAAKPLTVGDILTAATFFSKGASLAPGETTEIVETRKLEKTELEILAAAVEAISRSKDKA